MTFRIGVDIGGTFTDFALYDETSGAVVLAKVPTTSLSPDQGCLRVIRENAGPLQSCSYFFHGTTVGLNALLERRGATLGLLCTEGFRDTLEIRRGSRPPNSPIEWVPPPPLVPRYLRLPVRERMSRDGKAILPVDPISVARALRVFRDNNVDAIAVCLINSYANPEHELEVGRLLSAGGFQGYISLSHTLSREHREYERTSTTVIDAFVQARMADYLGRIQQSLSAQGFAGTSLIMRSGGGAMSFTAAESRAFETINSGPVAAAEGAAELSRVFALGDIITADVGGTSFDTCLIQNGRPNVLYQGAIVGHPIQSSWIDVRSIGAGGGSIAYVETSGLLHVGPRSSGSTPGPACYGRGGTEPTVTDAALVLGMLGHGQLASGLILDREAAERAILRIAAPLGRSVTQTAAGVIRIASAAMANAIREITIEQGIDPRTLGLLAIGGAGPMLATQIARELGIRRVLVPPYAGNFSAWGLLGSNITRESAQTVNKGLTDSNMGALFCTVAQMVDELTERSENDAGDSATFEISFDMRFAGQEHCLAIPVLRVDAGPPESAGSLSERFSHRYLAKYGILPAGDIEVTTIRILMRNALPARTAASRTPPASLVPPDRLSLYSLAESRELEGMGLRRQDIPRAKILSGPAVIYEDTTTTYVDVDGVFHVDENDFLIIELEKGS